jgi:hypothetical protein
LETISKEEFKRLCDEVYVDRFEIYKFNPGMSRRDAVLWMLTGCLISLLSITDKELQAISPGTDDYKDVVRRLLKERAEPPFDADAYVEELSKRVEND